MAQWRDGSLYVVGNATSAARVARGKTTFVKTGKDLSGNTSERQGGARMGFQSA